MTPGQGAGKRPTAAYLKAARAAINSVQEANDE